MLSISQRVAVLTLLVFLCSLWVERIPAQVIQAVPVPGDQFAIHQEQVSSGTYTFQSAPPGKFRTSLTADITALVIRNATQTNGWEASYQYDYLRVETQVEGASPTLLELWPTRMAVDGAVAYDSRLHPDVPPPLLVRMLLVDFRASFGNQGDLLRTVECEEFSRIFPFLDLSQPLHDTWMHRPPEPLPVGKKWVEDRPFRLWADRLTIPASQTYEVKSAPNGPNRLLSLSFSRVLRMTTPSRIQIPVGSQIPPELGFDALGENTSTLPPDLCITSLSANTQGTVDYRLDRGFPVSRQTSDQLDIHMEVPAVDGPELRQKHLQMLRTTDLHVEYHPARQYSEETRQILFGR